MSSESAKTASRHRPRYTIDEIAIGIVVALGIHVAAAAPFVVHYVHPTAKEDETPFVAKPVIAASLLKLGKPIDPKKLPDRFVPQQRTAPKPDKVASSDDPLHKTDGGAEPPPNTAEGANTKLPDKNDLFAEDAGKERPAEGSPNGSDAGLETDPSKVRAGDAYAATLSKFFHDRWQYPVSQGEANQLCVKLRVRLNPRMQIWYLKQEAVSSSGNELFDDSARTMLQKLLDDHTSLPEPPPNVAESYKGQTVDIALAGASNGDTSKCR